MEINAAQVNIRIQRLVVVVSVLLFVAKVAAYFLTGSIAILTDALESTVNVVTGFTGLFSLIVAARPRDGNHPYGHGKVELVSASFEGIMIVVAGGVIIYESCLNLLQPHNIQQLDAGILLVASTALVNYLLGAYCVRMGKVNGSIALTASGQHLKSDTYTTLGIILGLILIKLTGIKWIDSASAILFGGLILVQGYQIIRQTVAGIMDEADMELLLQVIKVLDKNKMDVWVDLHNLRIIKYGPLMHLDCHLSVPWYFNVNEAHKAVDALEALVAQNFPHALEMFVHLDGCMPPVACRVCALKNCSERKHPFEERLEWTFENVTKNQKHT
jgi:cation diffusion facilitator family transporter